MVIICEQLQTIEDMGSIPLHVSINQLSLTFVVTESALRLHCTDLVVGKSCQVRY